MTSFTRYFLFIIGIACSMPLQGSTDEPSSKSGKITLSFEQAWQQALSHNPDLSAAQSHVDAADSATVQAGTRPNPGLSLEAENFGGSGPNSGWDSAETTLLLSQPVETGGKRQARTTLARAGKDLSLAELESTRLDLWQTLVEHYVDALQAAELEAMARDTVRLAGDRYRLVSQRVQAGKVAPLESSRAEVEAALAGIEQAKARRQAKLTHCRLAVLMGKTKPDFDTLTGRLDSVQAWAPAEEARSTAPDLVRAEKERAARLASVKREESLAHPDVVVSAGVRRFEDNEEIAWVGGIALPLPLFDRNQAGIQKARHELSRAAHLQQAAILKQQIAREELLAEVDTAWNEIVVLRDKALPAAHDALGKAKTGYEQGKFSYLEWVDAERSFVSLRTRWLTTLAHYHKTLAAMSRLTGNTAGLTFFNRP